MHIKKNKNKDGNIHHKSVSSPDRVTYLIIQPYPYEFRDVAYRQHLYNQVY